MKFSTALETSHVLKATGGTFYEYAARVDSSAPTADYFVQVIDASSLPSNGAVTMLCGAVKCKHTSGVDDYPFVDIGDEGVVATNGIVIALSTTEFALTIAGAYLSITETVVL